MKRNSSNFIAPLLGNTVEYYDFALYGAFSPLIASYFFPVDISESLTLLTFALAFLMRPIGAMIFGYIGDVYGRKNAISLPMILMAIFTLIIFLLPSYNEIGITSSITLILCRLGQGFCMGGEYGGGLVFFIEHNKKEKRGFAAGLFGSSILLGALIANIVACIFTLSIFPTTFWKFPFLIGASVGFVGIWILNKATETPEFNHALRNEAPFVVILKKYHYPFIKAAAASGLNGLLGVFMYVYINFFLVNNLSWSISSSLCLISLGLAIATIVCPYFTYKAKNFSANNILNIFCGLFIILLIPFFYLINTNQIIPIIISVIFLSIIVGICHNAINLFVYDLFPVEVRYTGVALSDSIGRIIFASHVPFTCNYLFNLGSSYILPSLFIIFMIAAVLRIINKVFSHERMEIPATSR